MSFHLHELTGCAPAPLAHYLKALGILRLVCEQADPEARGFWRGERFFLISRMSIEQMESFFLSTYRPTPLVAPWLKGSGFYGEKDAGLSPIRDSTATRLQSFRDAIAAVDKMMDEIRVADRAIRTINAEAKVKGLSAAEREAIKDDPAYKKRLAEAKRKFKLLKVEDLLPSCRRSWRGPHQDWMSAALVLDADAEPSYPALLGTGGNDGRLDFTNNFMQQLAQVFAVDSIDGGPHPHSSGWLRAALWDQTQLGYQQGAPIGQCFPGGAGGANSGNGTDADSLVNPFDYLLLFEGAIALRAGATGTLKSGAGRAAAPFAQSPNSAGYSSASAAEYSSRGEQWMPLWSQPLSYLELRHMLAEGRAQLGRKSAADSFDFARSVARLGAARGIHSFQRFGYIERNGQANFAIPLGRFVVPENAGTSIRNLDDLETWLMRLNRLARDKDASSRLKLAVKCLLEDALAVAQQPERAAHWQSILISASNLEAIQASGTGFSAGPIPKLRKEWIEAANDGSAEFRLAVAFAAQAARFPSNRAAQYPIRDHFQTLANARFATSGSLASQRLLPAPQVVVLQRNATDDCIAIVGRRLIDRAKLDAPGFPLRARTGFTTTAADLTTLISGSVDLERTLRLARALCALNFRDARLPLSSESSSMLPDDAWLVIRLSLLPWPLVEDRQIPVDPAIVRRLSSGDAAGAFDLARQRLCAFGIHPTIRQTSQPSATAKWWAAALAFPLSQGTARRFLKRIDPNFSVSKQP